MLAICQKKSLFLKKKFLLRWTVSNFRKFIEKIFSCNNRRKPRAGGGWWFGRAGRAKIGCKCNVWAQQMVDAINGFRFGLLQKSLVG